MRFLCFYRRRRNRRKDPAITYCPVCSTRSPTGPLLPCGERYCTSCLKQHFSIALRTEPYTPPRCCGQLLPFSLLNEIDSAALLPKFRAKIPDPLNCATCGAWVLPEDVGDEKGRCRQCDVETCVVCENTAHKVGEVCSKESERGEVGFRRLVNRKGWRECKCGWVLSRDVGCAEVVCRCGNVEVLAF
ncbi:hypothetical protein EDC01DRAFT_619470 [Geopyxis carbonaria]|nr:hypothetical protein EDC01DRAFT_619470 [Geopyxis carbonaria]